MSRPAQYEIGESGCPVCSLIHSGTVNVFDPGTEVTADPALGGYSGVVLLPAGSFEALEGSGWRTATRIQVTEPADGIWEPGVVVDVESCLLTARET